MKYFKYTLWDNGDYKYSFTIHGNGINQINMPLFGEISNLSKTVNRLFPSV